MSIQPVKISRPRVKRAFVRSHLFKKLDQARGSSVVYIMAPPGAGKSTLLSTYVEKRKLPCIWYQVDERDQDVVTLFHYLNLAAKKAAPRTKQTLPLLSQPFRPELKTYALRYFEELYQRLKPPFLFVFDNYQEVPDTAIFHEIVRDGLAQLPQGFNAVVLSRIAPPPAFARLLAADQLAVLDHDALAFTEKETAIIVKRQLGTNLSPAAQKRLYNITHGWAAGIILLLKSAENSPTELDTRDQQAVFDYFAGEIFAGMDDDVQTLLLKSAFMDEMNPKTVQQVSGVSDAGRVLGELADKSYFTTRHSDRRDIYQFHPLFKHFLVSRARATFPPQTLLELQRKTAAVLATDKQPEQAIRLLLNAGDWDGAAPLIIEQAPVLMEQGRYQTLEQWLDRIPGATQKQHPWLLYWHGSCRQGVDTHEALSAFQRAFDQFDRLEDSTGVFLSWCGAVESILFSFASYDRLDGWVALLGQLRRRYKRFPTMEISARISADMHTALWFRQPDHPELPMWEKRVVRLMRLLKITFNTHHRVLVGTNLFYKHLWRGDFRKAKVLIDSLRPGHVLGSTNAVSQLAWYTIFTLYSWLNADHQTCIDSVGKALDIADHSGVHFWDFLLLVQAGHSRLSSGDLENAALYRERMLAVVDHSKQMEMAIYHDFCAQEACHKGEFARAVASAETAIYFGEQIGMVFPEGCFRMGYAEMLYEEGDVSAAMEQIKRAKRIATDMQSNLIEFRVLLLEAYIALDQGRRSEARLHLNQVLAMGRQRNYINWLWWRPEMVARLFCLALEANIETAYVQRLIRLRRLTPPTNKPLSDAWPFAIRIFTLGDFSIEVDGKTLPLSGKGQRRPLELLKILIAMGDHEVSQEKVLDALWPDSPVDTTVQALYTTLHRLRKFLRHEAAIEHHDGRLKLNKRMIWLDVWALQSLQKTIDHNLHGAHPDAATIQKHYDQIRHHYQGPFLQHETDNTWSLTLQESLHGRLLRTLAALGRFWEREGQWDTAITCYQHALEIDHLAEAFYQHLMRSYAHQGRKADAVATFQRCRKILATVLGVTPSPETVSIYKSVREQSRATNAD
ncbi:MAG: hypothetical protein BMS9Abin06_0942 [Gammaproteobacteria bacterium]|nr:MAG: hypothetical protein BMS9Abin06_0942 [Gammaproteobacteria bacterium]